MLVSECAQTGGRTVRNKEKGRGRGKKKELMQERVPAPVEL